MSAGRSQDSDTIWKDDPELGYVLGDMFVLCHGKKQEFIVPEHDPILKQTKIGCTQVSFKAISKLYWGMIKSNLLLRWHGEWPKK
jgi:hypothetical protein